MEALSGLVHFVDAETRLVEGEIERVHDVLDAERGLGGDEDVHIVVDVFERFTGAAADDDGAVFRRGDLLEVLEHVLHHLLRKVGAAALGQAVEDGTAGFFVITLQDLRVEVVLSGDVVDDAVIVDFAVQDFCQFFRDDGTLAAVVSRNVDNDFFCHYNHSNCVVCFLYASIITNQKVCRKWVLGIYFDNRYRMVHLIKEKARAGCPGL